LTANNTRLPSIFRLGSDKLRQATHSVQSKRKEVVNEKSIPTLNPSEFKVSNYLNILEDLLGANFNSVAIHKIEEHKDFIKFPLLPHRKTVNDFLYITEGLVVRNIAMEKYFIQKNNILFLNANDITSTDFVSDDAKGYYCHFDNNISRDIAIKLKIDFDRCSLFTVTNAMSKILSDLLGRIITLQFSDNISLITAYLSVFFMELEPLIGNFDNQNSSSEQIFKSFKKYVKENIYSFQLVRDYAKLLNITPNHLNKIVKKVSDRTAQEWINEMIILESKVLLRQTNLSISTIAEKLRKQDPSDFGRFFKHKTGLTPTEYRKKD
jgi:AraC family transcriptional regulator, transcriptional activator of pobA